MDKLKTAFVRTKTPIAPAQETPKFSVIEPERKRSENKNENPASSRTKSVDQPRGSRNSNSSGDPKNLNVLFDAESSEGSGPPSLVEGSVNSSSSQTSSSSTSETNTSRSPRKHKFTGTKGSLTPKQFDQSLDRLADKATGDLVSVMNLFLHAAKGAPGQSDEQRMDNVEKYGVLQATPLRPPSSPSVFHSLLRRRAPEPEVTPDGGLRSLNAVALAALGTFMPGDIDARPANYYERYSEVVLAACKHWKTADLKDIGQIIDGFLSSPKSAPNSGLRKHLQLLRNGIDSTLKKRIDEYSWSDGMLSHACDAERQHLNPMGELLIADLRRLKLYAGEAATTVSFQTGEQKRNADAVRTPVANRYKQFDPEEGKLGNYAQARYQRWIKDVGDEFGGLNPALKRALAIDALAGLAREKPVEIDAMLASLSAHELAEIQESPSTGLASGEVRAGFQAKAREAEHDRLIRDIGEPVQSVIATTKKIRDREPSRYRSQADGPKFGVALVIDELERAAAIVERLRTHFPGDRAAQAAIEKAKDELQMALKITVDQGLGLGDADPETSARFNAAVKNLDIDMKDNSSSSRASSRPNGPAADAPPEVASPVFRRGQVPASPRVFTPSAALSPERKPPGSRQT